MTTIREIERRVTELEEHVANLEAAAAAAVEEARRAIGRLDRAADYCRKLSKRLEDLEAADRRHAGGVAKVASSVRVAGAALMTAPRLE